MKQSLELLKKKENFKKQKIPFIFSEKFPFIHEILKKILRDNPKLGKHLTLAIIADLGCSIFLSLIITWMDFEDISYMFYFIRAFGLISLLIFFIGLYNAIDNTKFK